MSFCWNLFESRPSLPPDPRHTTNPLGDLPPIMERLFTLAAKNAVLDPPLFGRSMMMPPIPNEIRMALIVLCRMTFRSRHTYKQGSRYIIILLFIVERRGFEPRISGCKPDVFPLLPSPRKRWRCIRDSNPGPSGDNRRG